MRRIHIPALLLLRLAITGWVFAAILFVILTVREIQEGEFPSILLDQIVLLRFPVYYFFSQLLLGIACLAGLALLFASRCTRRLQVGIGFTIAAFFVFLLDYWLVYPQLVDMLTPLGSPRPQTFSFYHQLTERLNALAVLLAMTGMFLVHLPGGDSGRRRKDNPVG